jgi:hypothetical protein
MINGINPRPDGDRQVRRLRHLRGMKPAMCYRPRTYFDNETQQNPSLI